MRKIGAASSFKPTRRIPRERTHGECYLELMVSHFKNGTINLLSASVCVWKSEANPYRSLEFVDNPY